MISKEEILQFYAKWNFRVDLRRDLDSHIIYMELENLFTDNRSISRGL